MFFIRRYSYIPRLRTALLRSALGHCFTIDLDLVSVDQFAVELSVINWGKERAVSGLGLGAPMTMLVIFLVLIPS